MGPPDCSSKKWLLLARFLITGAMISHLFTPVGSNSVFNKNPLQTQEEEKNDTCICSDRGGRKTQAV